jgi:hypothetical protein
MKSGVGLKGSMPCPAHRIVINKVRIQAIPRRRRIGEREREGLQSAHGGLALMSATRIG